MSGGRGVYRVTFERENITVPANPGEMILEVMRRAGLKPDAPCGGHGKCGKCLVRINGKEPVLACQTAVENDVLIDSMLGEKKTAILTEGGRKNHRFAPALRQLLVTVPPCPAGESVSDWKRFSEAVAKELHDGSYDAVPDLASRIGQIAKEHQRQVWTVVCGRSVLDVTPEQERCCMAAFDIGTTTVAGYLLNAPDGTVLAVASRLNPQSQYGADVINRANYTLEHGMTEVTVCIRNALNEMLDEMTKAAGTDPGHVYQMSVVGNTCMHHLFLGISPDSLVHAPYNPVIDEAMQLRASDCGIHIHERGIIWMLPNIAGFVGADTVGCLVSSRLADEPDWTLLIDIGTNGEMVLGKGHQMAACSTAAGPAFEGAGITWGMRGSTGAVSKVFWNDGKWEIKTVDNAPVVGICGSGLLDLAAQLLESGQMDEYGELQEGPGISVRETEGPTQGEAAGGAAFGAGTGRKRREKYVLLAAADESGNGQEITLEQKDIRELQLAKSAIASGVYLLSEKMGIRVEQIRQVWLAGAFGSFLSPESACRIGLIPPQLKGRITSIGNAALVGAQDVLLDAKLWEEAGQLALEAGFLELASMPEFQDRFVDELEFPES